MQHSRSDPEYVTPNMQDTISEVQIDEEGRLTVKPTTEKFPYIYREAMEVHWDEERKFLYSPTPRKWSYEMWFRHIISAAQVQGCSLSLFPATRWINVPDDIRKAITDGE